MDQQHTNAELSRKMGAILYKALEETIGQKDLNDALEMASVYGPADQFPANHYVNNIHFDDVCRLQASLEKLYGLRGSQGLALRSGRACFKYGLREFGTQLGYTETAFRLLPLNLKIYTAAQLFAESLNKAGYKRVLVEENATQVLVHIENCPFCQNRHADSGVCFIAIGLLQEALYWLSGGKHFRIEETDCIAKGDPRCTLVLQKQPVE
jgi:predicted hydrocarbon binding protein